VKDLKIIEGIFESKGYKMALIVSRIHDAVTEELLNGALRELEMFGVLTEDIIIYKVPGCVEIPRMASIISAKTSVDAILCLGALIRSGSPSFDFVGSEITRQLLNLSVTSRIPVLYGIVTADNLEEAIIATGIKEKNYGRRTAKSAVELLSLEAKV
jgi:6,7-dimethyl-8-ribityllumazine synthase